MRKSEYMQILQEKLQRYNGALQQEILEDYEQHFMEGLAAGRSEEEIIEELGGIEDMLQEFSEEDLKKEIEAVEAQARQSGSYEQIYKAVVIDGLLADVKVTPSEDDRIWIDYENRGNKAQKQQYCFYQYKKDGVFYAGVKELKDKENGIKGFRGVFAYGSWSGGNIELSVEIPAGIPEIKLHTTSGDLEVREIQTQELEVQCTSGDQQIKNVSCRKLDAQTFSGDLEISNVRMNVREQTKLELRTTSGDLKAAGLSAAEVHMQTASGELELENIQGDQIRLRTNSGDMDGRSIRGSELSAEAGSGELELEDIQVDQIRLRTGSGDMDGRKIQGGELSAEAGSGEIHLETGAENCRVTTGSGDIDLRADTGMRKIRLGAGSGEIHLNLKRISGASIVAGSRSGRVIIRGDRVSGHNHSCSYGDGACQVEINTGSGNITVE